MEIECTRKFFGWAIIAARNHAGEFETAVDFEELPPVLEGVSALKSELLEVELSDTRCAFVSMKRGRYNHAGPSSPIE